MLRPRTRQRLSNVVVESGVAPRGRAGCRLGVPEVVHLRGRQGTAVVMLDLEMLGARTMVVRKHLTDTQMACRVEIKVGVASPPVAA
jgi:hypothetical protein